jgi:hypothetical protein
MTLNSNEVQTSFLSCLFCRATVRFQGLPATRYENHLCKYFFTDLTGCIDIRQTRREKRQTGSWPSPPALIRWLIPAAIVFGTTIQTWGRLLVCHRRNETCQTPLFPPLEKIPKTPESASPGSYQQWWSFTGPGKLMYMFSTERLRISAPHQASVGRASRRGSGKQKSTDVEWNNVYVDLPLTVVYFITTKAQCFKSFNVRLLRIFVIS